MTVGAFMTRTLLLASAVALLLPACSSTLPVTGQMMDGSESFTGSATGYLDGGGTVELVTNKGVKCSGSFVYVTRRNGSGTFTCANGESGPFSFVSTGQRGTGTGTIGGRPVTFTFG